MSYRDRKGYEREHSNAVHRHRAYHYIYLKDRKKYPLPFGAYEVHHIDWDKTNNRMDNLALLTPEQHDLEHDTMKTYGLNNFEFVDLMDFIEENYPDHLKDFEEVFIEKWNDMVKNENDFSEKLSVIRLFHDTPHKFYPAYKELKQEIWKEVLSEFKEEWNAKIRREKNAKRRKELMDNTKVVLGKMGRGIWSGLKSIKSKVLKKKEEPKKEEPKEKPKKNWAKIGAINKARRKRKKK